MCQKNVDFSHKLEKYAHFRYKLEKLAIQIKDEH